MALSVEAHESVDAGEHDRATATIEEALAKAPEFAVPP